MKLEAWLTICLMVVIALGAAIFGVFKNTIPNGNERMVIVEMKLAEVKHYCCSEVNECK